VADLVTFIRNGWGNQAPAVSADQVAKLRKDLPKAAEADKDKSQ
jgi:hypothetical protein